MFVLFLPMQSLNYAVSADPTVLEGHTDAVRRVLWHGAHTLLSCASDKSIRLWDLRSGDAVQCTQLDTIIKDISVYVQIVSYHC